MALAFMRRWFPLVVLTAVLGVAWSPVVSRAAEKDADEEKEDEAKKEGAALSAVGGLSVISADTTLLLIGVTADAFAKDVYTPEQVRGIMKPVIKQLDAVSTLLRKLQEAGLSDQDDDYIDQIIELYRLLQDEARALDKFVLKKGKAEADAFEKARKAAVKALGKLTGGDKEEEKEEEK